MMLLYRKKPKTYVSKASEESDLIKEKNFNFKSEITQLFRNKNYILLVMIFTLQYSVYTCLSAVMNSITRPYGYTPLGASLMGVSFVVLGVTGGLVFSIIIDKSQCYLKMLRFINCGSIIAGGLAFWCLPTGNITIFCSNLGMLGLFLLPIIAIGLSFCAELAYPISDSLSSGIMMLTSQVYGTIVSYLATYLIENLNSPLAALGLFSAQFILSLFLTIFLKEDLRRINAGKQGLKQISKELMIAEENT